MPTAGSRTHLERQDEEKVKLAKMQQPWVMNNRKAQELIGATGYQ